ncbi:MAG: exosortase H-associated membrane protein [Xanthomonadales bacterium]|nr:exosortase H-associated membrane protein [Xanthomonadales bacterium]
MGKMMKEPAGSQDLRLGELLILAVLWMVFGFMLWYYLSAFHGAPVRILSSEILSALLGSDFQSIIPNPDRHYLFQVQTNIPFQFPDGSREALGFIVNPLIFGYGLPLLFGLVMASGVSMLRKLGVLLGGYVGVMLIQVWGVVWQSLKMLSFNFGGAASQVITDAGIPADLIALCYQLGVLIFPPLVPIIIWVLANWALIEQFTGWQKDTDS